jgi:hypothetical protein
MRVVPLVVPFVVVLVRTSRVHGSRASKLTAILPHVLLVLLHVTAWVIWVPLTIHPSPPELHWV